MIIKLIEKYSDLISSWKIVEYDQDGLNLKFKAEFEFTDGSRLEAIFEEIAQFFQMHRVA